MKNNLWLIDLDLTLIDKTYQPTIDVAALINIVQYRKREYRETPFYRLVLIADFL